MFSLQLNLKLSPFIFLIKVQTFEMKKIIFNL